MKRLQDKVALVFGAGSSGDAWSNGKATAVAYARHGARVVAVDRVEAAAQETADVIAAENNTGLAVCADVTNAASVAAAVEQTIKTFGRIDILHNNVGTAVMGGPMELEEEDWQRIVDINLGSIYRTAKAVLPHMLEQGGGTIINISSVASIRWVGYPFFVYYATKAGLNHATVALAMQYAKQGIRANAILPGLIDTPLIYREVSGLFSSVEAMCEARNRAVPRGRMGSPWDIANAAVFLASDEASFINGVCLPVDGGHSCGVGGGS